MIKFNDILDISCYVSSLLENIDINQYDIDFEELVLRVSSDFRDFLINKGYKYGDFFYHSYISDKEFWDLLTPYEKEQS